MSERLHVLTQSALTILASCEERFRLRYLERMAPLKERPALAFGSAFHRGIELRSPEAASVMLREGAATWTQDEADALEVRCATAEAMVHGALVLWTDWPTLQEQRFQVPLVNPATRAESTAHELGGRLDGAWTDKPWLLELKTTSRLDGDYLARLDIDFQVSTYLAAAERHYGQSFDRVVYRVARKPSIAQRKTESVAEFCDRLRTDYLARPEFYFAEAIVRRTREQRDRWAAEAWEQHVRVLRLENGGMSVRNTSHCLDYGRCDYFDLCVGAVGPDAFRVLDTPNPELDD